MSENAKPQVDFSVAMAAIDEAIVEDRLQLARQFLCSLQHAHRMTTDYEDIIRNRIATNQKLDLGIFHKRDLFLGEREAFRAALCDCLFVCRRATEAQKTEQKRLYDEAKGYGYGERPFGAFD